MVASLPLSGRPWIPALLIVTGATERGRDRGSVCGTSQETSPFKSSPFQHYQCCYGTFYRLNGIIALVSLTAAFYLAISGAQ